MIEKIIQNGFCSGCHACYSICPCGAISMENDAEGFLYPRVDGARCIECGQCQKVCAAAQRPLVSQHEPTVYAAINKDDTVRQNSSSGGVFALLAEHIIGLSGVVYGAAFNEDFAVEHWRTEQNITPLQTSKYVQSRIGDVFRAVDRDLRDGRYVLFTGTPCQVDGLDAYLTARSACRDKLYLVDLICHGVPSPLVWQRHLDGIAQGKSIKSINFRDKSISWGTFSLKIMFNDGSVYRRVASDDAYMKGFCANLTLRPSCYSCAHKAITRVSDLTIADCWGAQKTIPALHDNKGTSAVLIHTAKGHAIVEGLANQMQMVEVSIEQIVPYNTAINASSRMHPRRALFYERMQKDTNGNIDDMLTNVLKPTITDHLLMGVVHIKRIGKKLLKKLHILV